MKRLAIPPADHPLVSVVMVTYGGKQWVPPAVEALVANTSAPFELIVVDNASKDGVQDLLRTIEGAKLIFNAQNVGFGPGANQGVLHATGKFVCLLNSDAFVEPGWLPPMIEVLENDPGAGAVVPCLLHMDGALQEAGGVVGSDGSTRALGDGGDPTQLEFRFRRYVDYGSAACMLLKRAVFLRVGGFDPAYPLGYCEDVDLCFALEELGLRTVYEPRSFVRHVRWGSSSRIEAERRVFANQPILLARWRERLAGRPSFAEPPFLAHDVLQARDADCFDRILVVTDSAWGCPGGPSARLSGLAREMTSQWPDARITLLAGAGETEATLGALLQAGVEIAAEKDWDAWFESRRYHYSAVIVPGPACFEHFDPLIAATQPQASRIYDFENLVPRCAPHLEAWWPGIGDGPAGARAQRLASLERWGLDSADVVLCSSSADLSAVGRRTPAFVVPDLVSVAPVACEESEGLLVLGDLPGGLGFEEATGNELLGPLRSILAEVAELCPDESDRLQGCDGVAAVCLRSLARLLTSGSAWPPARVHMLPPPFVAGSASASIVAGVPLVLWRGAAENLELGDLEDALVADNPAEFARKVRDLLNDRTLWQDVHSALLQLARSRFDSAASRRSLRAAFAHCGLGPPSQRDHRHNDILF